MQNQWIPTGKPPIGDLTMAFLRRGPSVPGRCVDHARHCSDKSEAYPETANQWISPLPSAPLIISLVERMIFFSYLARKVEIFLFEGWIFYLSNVFNFIWTFSIWVFHMSRPSSIWSVWSFFGRILIQKWWGLRLSQERQAIMEHLIATHFSVQISA